jgi:hypothetical protein
MVGFEKKILIQALVLGFFFGRMSHFDVTGTNDTRFAILGIFNHRDSSYSLSGC